MASMIYKKRKKIFNEYYLSGEYTDELDDEIDLLIFSIWNKYGLNFPDQYIALWYIKNHFTLMIKEQKVKFDSKINKQYLKTIDNLYGEVLSNFKEIKEDFFETLILERRIQKVKVLMDKISNRNNL